ncbi:hypothetical protein B10172_14730 [Campylobacter jejuni]|nr:hypothetical protein B10172_14730 [Campylobacter jejuni]
MFQILPQTEIFINGSKYVNYDYSKIANICRNNTYYFDASEIDPDNVFQSMIKFSSFFDKEIDKKVLIEEMEYLREKNIQTYMQYYQLL